MRVVVPYEHNPADLGKIYLAITASTLPSPDSWRHALRDTVNGRRVVWADFPSQGRTVSVWVRDRDGDRKVVQMMV